MYIANGVFGKTPYRAEHAVGGSCMFDGVVPLLHRGCCTPPIYPCGAKRITLGIAVGRFSIAPISALFYENHIASDARHAIF